MSATPAGAVSAAQLANIDLFRGVGLESIEAFAERMQRREVAAGVTLLQPDTDNQTLFAVLSGRLHVFLDAEYDQPLATLGPGACAGELSIIDSRKPSAYVVAAEPCELLVMDHATLWELIDASHPVARNLLTVLARRLRFDSRVVVDARQILSQYERNAMTDALTELYNRYWMDSAFPRRVSRSAREGEPLSLAMLDLDNFKQFNDSRGHQRGDDILCLTAQTLRDLLRPTDLLARYGGDEFAALLPNTTCAQALTALERVRRGLTVRLREAGADMVSLSAGVAELAPGESLPALLRRADEALYRAKDRGRNSVSA